MAKLFDPYLVIYLTENLSISAGLELRLTEKEASSLTTGTTPRAKYFFSTGQCEQIWRDLKSLWPFLEELFSIWQNCELILANI